MKTNDMVSFLASGDVSVNRTANARRFALALIVGLLLSTGLMLALLGVRPDLAQAASQPMFWAKIGFAAALAVTGLLSTWRLGRPGRSLGRLPTGMATPVVIMWGLAAMVLVRAAPDRRMDLLLGDTWASCPLLIALLSAPLLATALWAMRALAPTRLRLAGASAGMLAGATAALVYCLHCPEMSAAFIGLWYFLGILIPTALGALLGPRMLRW
ncbi:DUF1109 domain-containing protein [Guyparkeria sp. 1SP6A2]|nr:DUF1109 domain-containing protein [Guyparkeria sp. 1SP6A2]